MPILQNLIEKYKPKRGKYVYRLSYGGKYVIVKGLTLAGSLFFIQKGYGWFNDQMDNQKVLYRYFYKHIKETPGKRFRVRVLLCSKNAYSLLKREQNELDKARYDTNCLNNAVEAYVPLYLPLTESYGWIENTAVANFQKYLKSDIRKKLLASYKKKQRPLPAKRGS